MLTDILLGVIRLPYGTDVHEYLVVRQFFCSITVITNKKNKFMYAD